MPDERLDLSTLSLESRRVENRERLDRRDRKVWRFGWAVFGLMAFMAVGGLTVAGIYAWRNAALRDELSMVRAELAEANVRIASLEAQVKALGGDPGNPQPITVVVPAAPSPSTTTTGRPTITTTAAPPPPTTTTVPCRVQVAAVCVPQRSTP